MGSQTRTGGTEKPMMTIPIRVDLDADDIAGNASRDEALEFVKALDHAFHDWDFTLELYEHFAKLKQEHVRETVEDQTGGCQAFTEVVTVQRDEFDRDPLPWFQRASTACQVVVMRGEVVSLVIGGSMAVSQ